MGSEYVLEISAGIYFFIAIMYELKIRAEASKVKKDISGLTYITLGFVMKPMINIMLLKSCSISKKLKITACLFAAIHYWIIGVLIFMVINA